jgi:hypothetical protein
MTKLREEDVRAALTEGLADWTFEGGVTAKDIAMARTIDRLSEG